MQEIEAGLYRHYKGKNYWVFEVATHSETRERLVVYRALYDDHGLYIRPLKMFCEDVVIDGQTMPRFRKVSEG